MQIENIIQFKSLIGQLRNNAQGNERAIRLIDQAEKAVDSHSGDSADTKLSRSLAEELSELWTRYYIDDHCGDDLDLFFQRMIEQARDFHAAK